MNIQEKIEELEKQLQELKEEVSKSEEQFPKEGDYYYFIGSKGELYGTLWHNYDSDRGSLKIGNVFKAKENAEFMVERLKVLAELRKLSRPYIFDDTHDNYGICYDHSLSKINVYIVDEVQHNIHYFDTPEETKAAIQKIGEDRLKKYYLGIGEEK